MIGKFTIDLKW